MSGIMQALIGGLGKRINLGPHTIAAADFEAVNAASATATFLLQSSGQASATTSGNASNPPAGTTNYDNEWMITGASSDYESRATLQSGTLSSGTTGTWQVLSTTRSWAVSSSIGAGGGTGPSNAATILVEIRDATTLIVLDSGTIIMTAESSSG